MQQRSGIAVNRAGPKVVVNNAREGDGGSAFVSRPRQGRAEVRVDADWYRAAAGKCRGWAPELYFAGHFLPRSGRYALYVVVAVCQQLHEIVVMSLAEEAAMGEGGGCCGGAGDGGVAGLVAGDGKGGAGGGAASTGRGQTGRQVCAAVLEHLFSGQVTGQAHLDGFQSVVEGHGLEIGDFVELVEGMILVESIPLVATWGRARGVWERVSGAAVRIVERLAGEVPREEPVAGARERRDAQARAMGVGILWGLILNRIGQDWAKRILRLPLDDLAEHGLSDADVGRMVERGTDGGDGRWARLMAAQTERAGNLLRGGAGSLKTVASGPWRRALAVLCTMHGHLLDRIAKRDVFSGPAGNNFWVRLRWIPAAIRLASAAERG